MGKKVIGMISSYGGLTQCDWLWKQTAQGFGVWGEIQMLSQAAAPDFLLLYNFTDFPKASPPRSWFRRNTPSAQEQQEAFQPLLRGVPKERIISLVREPPFPEREAARIADYKQAQTYCGYVSGPDRFAPISEPMPAIWYVGSSFRELNEMGPPDKLRPRCWITSGIDRTDHHRQRLAFMKLVRSSGLELDLYGRDLPEWAQAMGKVENKWNVMAPYHYNLAIENYAENEWYVSEKLWDALLAWCLPIYYGGPAADRLLPPGSFLRLPSLDQKGIDYIREVTATPDAWYAAKEAIAEARQIILHRLNLLNWLDELTARLG